MTYPIPNVTPSYTFQDKGLGAAVQEGVAGLIQALQAKAHLDNQAKELDQQERQLQAQIQQGQSGMEVDRARIKQTQEELKAKKKQHDAQVAAYRAFAPLGMGKGFLDPKLVAEARTTLKDPEAMHEFDSLLDNAIKRQESLVGLQQKQLNLQQDRAKKPAGSGTGTDPNDPRVARAARIWEMAQSAFKAADDAWQKGDQSGPRPVYDQFLEAEARRDGTTAAAVKRMRRKFWGTDAAPEPAPRLPGRSLGPSKKLRPQDVSMAQHDPAYAAWLAQQGYSVG